MALNQKNATADAARERATTQSLALGHSHRRQLDRWKKAACEQLLLSLLLL
jgi:hypothetical protein